MTKSVNTVTGQGPLARCGIEVKDLMRGPDDWSGGSHGRGGALVRPIIAAPAGRKAGRPRSLTDTNPLDGSKLDHPHGRSNT